MARTKGVSLAFRAALFICVIQRAAGATFEIQNKCAFTVWAAASAGGAKRLGKGQSWTLQVPAGSEGKFWGRTGCSFDGSGRGNCKIGDCGGLNCQRWENPPVTLVKYALNQTFNFENLDFYGISLVNGFNLPMSIIPSDSLCNAIACSSNINAICPNALRVSEGCESACAALNTPQYCCTGDYLNSCNQSSYSEFFKGQCPQAYIYAKDEASGLFGCSTGSDYRVVFCDGAAASLQVVETLDAIQRRIDKKDWISDPRYLIEWDGISCDNTSSAIRRSEINWSRRNLTGAVTQCIGRLTALVNVSLDNNHLIGAFPNFSNSTMLERLHLQNNNLTGSVPDWLSQLKNLKELFINNNNFSGIIPRQLLDKPSLNLTYSGNCYLCMHKGECQRVSRKDKMSVVLGIKISGALILVLVLVVGIAVYRKKFKIKQEDYSMIMVPNPTISRSFTLDEIVQATQNFSRKIGQGGFGSVFFGKLPEEKDIAVKVLSFFTREGVHQFQNEVDLLSKFHHKNLVSLLGYCNESRKLMLIYEHMSQGSLRDHLYGSCAEVSQLNWKTRLQVALDAAQGLEYLHVGCNPKIIHRDVKTANILLDGHMNGKLADFGISRITINGATHVTTAVKGTIGYVDPEYFHTQMLTEKSDVYSFGVVLLEIICGRPPINARLPKEELNLIDWVRPYVEMDENLGDIAVIIDKRLGGNYNMKSIAGVVKLAFRCIKAKPYSRPSVSEVVAQIKKAIIQENENNVTLPNLEGTGTEHGVLQTCLVRSRVESRPREMEWADNSSNLSQVGR